MKYLLFTIVLLLSINIKGQELPKESNVFVRVYNNKIEKIAKGQIIKITDSTLVLKKGRKSITVLSSKIGYLKTKKSKGHNVLIGSLVGLGIPIVGLSQSKGLETLAFIIATPVFAAIGSGIGYLTTFFKKSKHYSIQGDTIKWQSFKEEMYAPQN